jgi:soluble lytic murein transglycosylase-like protein
MMVMITPPCRPLGHPCHTAARLGRWLAALAAQLALVVPSAAQLPGIDSQLADSLLAVPAPLVAPKAPLNTVVPSQVLRWRQEAQALEHGENGMPRDPARAATLYCQAAQHGDAEAQFSLAWMLTNGRGIERDDAQAAHLFLAAAEQGMPQAQAIMQKLGTPLGEPPPCLRPMAVQLPVLPAPVATAQQPARRGAPPPALPEPPLPANAPTPIVNFVKMVAPEFKLSPQLVLAIIGTESGFNPNAVSPKNAQGLMHPRRHGLPALVDGLLPGQRGAGGRGLQRRRGRGEPLPRRAAVHGNAGLRAQGAEPAQPGGAPVRRQHHRAVADAAADARGRHAGEPSLSLDSLDRRAERRAAPSRPAIPLGDRSADSPTEGRQVHSAKSSPGSAASACCTRSRVSGAAKVLMKA